MKTRHGFVSNSSTTSFCVYGIVIEASDLSERLKKLDAMDKKPDVVREAEYECDHEFDRVACKFCPECGLVSAPIENEDEDELDYDDIDTRISELGLDGRSDCEGEYWYIGCCLGLHNFSRDEKLNLVKNYNEKLEKFFPDIEPEFHEYSSDGG